MPESMQCLSFGVWVTEPNITLSGLLCFISFFFKAKRKFLCVNLPKFRYLLINRGTSSRLHVLVIVNRAAIKVGVQESLSQDMEFFGLHTHTRYFSVT